MGVNKDIVAMICLTGVAITSICLEINHDLLMLIVGGLISLGGAVVGSETAKTLVAAKNGVNE